MHSIKRTDSDDADFRALVKELDAFLAVIDGDEHAFYAQYNKLDAIKHTVVLYENDEPVGCGAVKRFDDQSMEVKRMFVKPEKQGGGLATKILKELEEWTKELGYAKCVLETGKRQPDAIALYKKNHYVVIENFGQYVNDENSVCFEKIL